MVFSPTISNYIWVINKFIAYTAVLYIGGFMVWQNDNQQEEWESTAKSSATEGPGYITVFIGKHI